VEKSDRSVVIEHSTVLGRDIRKDDLPELGISSNTKLEEAIKAGKKEEALKLLEYMTWESIDLHDLYCDWIYANLDYVAKNYGEEELPNILKNAFRMASIGGYKDFGSIPLEEVVYKIAEEIRSHSSGPSELGSTTLTEDQEKFVITMNPCGSGGRLRRGELDGTASRTEPPFNLGKTLKGYPWSWGKAGVPYYCVHCCIWGELSFIETFGYPLRITEYSDDPQKPCSYLFYKDPEKIPDKYFERVGAVKDPSKFFRRPTE
jgi:hypothetical protein